jgi:hypothetical protein
VNLMLFSLLHNPVLDDHLHDLEGDAQREMDVRRLGVATAVGHGGLLV